MADEQPPGLDEIEERFAAVLAGRITRDEADRWAARWYSDDTVARSGTARWALELLFGIDLPAGPDGGYLHPDEQIRDWLDELRRRRAAQGHQHR